MTDRTEAVAEDGRRVVATEAWRLLVPRTTGADAPLLVIPTVHPRGDRRIIRCAQVALDVGLRVHILWLGHGSPSTDVAASETVLVAPKNAIERIRLVRSVARSAAAHPAMVWHIHDFYVLGAAKRWQRRTGRSVLYDVHEYYPMYYSQRVRAPRFLQRFLAAGIERYQVRAAKRLGGANVVTEQMAAPFRAAAVRTTVSPNYPLLEQFRGLPVAPFAERRWRVLHIGTLSQDYGTHLLLDLASRAAARGLPFEFEVIARFPSVAHEADFLRQLDAVGAVPNLRLIPPRPTHEMAELLGTAGFGLSLLTASGQFEEAVPSKSYEHAIAGLVDVVTDRAAQRHFAETHGVPVSGHGDDPDRMLDQMLALAEDAEETDRRLREVSAAAAQRFTWEAAVEPGLSALLRDLAHGGVQ